MLFYLTVRYIYQFSLLLPSYIFLLVYVTSLCLQLAGVPVNVTLSIVREQGSSGEVEIHYQTRPALYQPPSNQASAGQDYTPNDNTIIMINGATVALVTVTILPVGNVSSNKKLIESMSIKKTISGIRLICKLM